MVVINSRGNFTPWKDCNKGPALLFLFCISQSLVSSVMITGHTNSICGVIVSILASGELQLCHISDNQNSIFALLH